ncbi:SepM family pheromone-processing serine protease [Anaerobacillus sp. MEB173]|uniref:SepM family pheromone-processing serine protease n=1 Tax=Anaerobacillus sp. MEB173 TaxID=3383345 RepID=UPI003F911F94
MVKEKDQKKHKGWLIALVIVLAVNFYQLPYYYTQPGDAKVLAEIIEVEDGYEEEGSFMLTTVRQQKANIIHYVWAKMSEYRELFHEDQFRFGDETDEEYHHRQLMMMSSSKELATVVAYEKAGKSVTFENRGVIVTSFIDGMSAEEKLKQGDKVIAIDGIELETADELLERLAKRDKGDPVLFTIVRENKEMDVTLVMTPFPKETGVDAERVGVGIRYPVTDRVMNVDPDVSIDTRRIGGPSAGLMFALEIYNQLVVDDITKGYHIAGTGTINEEGVVGRIGGVKQKVVAADKANADIFFAPNEEGSIQSNYIEAKAAAEDIKTSMKIVPVNTFDEAIQYLQELEPKKG